MSAYMLGLRPNFKNATVQHRQAVKNLQDLRWVQGSYEISRLLKGDDTALLDFIEILIAKGLVVTFGVRDFLYVCCLTDLEIPKLVFSEAATTMSLALVKSFNRYCDKLREQQSEQALPATAERNLDESTDSIPAIQ